jgi:hypothetical protein
MDAKLVCQTVGVALIAIAVHTSYAITGRILHGRHHCRPHDDRTHAGVMLDKETFYVSSVDQLVFTHCDRPALIM